MKLQKPEYINISLYLLMSFADNFANGLDPDQVRPDLDPKLFDSMIVFFKEFLEKVFFENKSNS